MHGLLQTSMIFAASGKDSLALSLVNAGYDVWLGNNRGNRHSRQHASLTMESDDFWHWSIDELGSLDMPAMVECVLAVNGAPQLAIVGHSQGAAQTLAALACDDQGWWQQRVALFVAMSASSSLRGFDRWPMLLLQKVYANNPLNFFAMFGSRAFIGALEMWYNFIPLDILTYLEAAFYTELLGWSTTSWTNETARNYFSEVPGGTSTSTVAHWMQNAIAKEFSSFTRDSTCGDRYCIEKIHCPTAVVYGGLDTLIDPEPLLKGIPILVGSLCVPEHGHMDNLCGNTHSVNKYIAGLMQKHLPTHK